MSLIGGIQGMDLLYRGRRGIVVSCGIIICVSSYI